MSSNDIVEILKDVIADKTQPAEERARAASVLQFYVAKEQEPLPGGLTDDRVVAGMLARVAAFTLWSMPEKYVIETVTADGVTRQNVIRKKEPAPTEPVLPGFTSAVPLPVMQVSDVEK